ncbi:Uncharacterized protein APZ42_000705 [Daphnia magna]|uniref:Cc8K15.2-like protein n=2 Tax=Daphnia magna TaxID=35525 RepID=A0A164JFZ2_9CRUS|nr:Uncharacterized protein APZ42_000705 [Daphnia magna]
MSLTTVHRQRQQLRKEISDGIKESFIPPSSILIHWDSKLIKYLTGKVDDRVAILISGKPDLENPKLLGIPVIANSTGEAQHNAVIDLLREWKVFDKVVGLVFDTTASNTGRLKGSATSIEKTLGRAVLWFACRHHVYEIHVKHVSDSVMGKRNSPSEALFVRFQKDWKDFDQEQSNLVLFDWEVNDDLINVGHQVLEWATGCLASKTFPREDYRELVQLTVLFLGGTVPDFRFRKPGAHHHARFMAYSIYFLKMQLLSYQFEMSHEESKAVKEMSIFIALFHSEAFLKSRLSTISPAVDLKYLSLMQLYKQENLAAATVAIKSVHNHLWYLTEEAVVLSIFDSELDSALRQRLVEKLLTIPRPKSYAPGKPKFPKINSAGTIIDYPNQLTTFLGPRSWLLFSLLNLGDECFDWMYTPVDSWKNMAGYKKIEKIVRSFEVVNDCAERAIKLISDFKDTVVKVTDQEYLFQVIEDHRTHFTSFNKSSLKNL